ncbi:conserved hypothetical protein [Desulfonatronospira thiodismutans ASO3-1]|uniref:ABM domain-containing protein n=1 Tax=Desulfonatronospira thiodismutans ASO3-1 TaxID=555779 RepID=D6SKD9_9BACT|nr:MULTISPECIES: hypothetical protein [Desulfonatronospira]EFI36342.1 conserved hypothetical protein [Desulfonatronospira thiodismutans ASO3-1]RQD79192.1 MAG: hypothetical protein D5S03_00750 [Desulfonatronospira sp. MSAO_Bac3]
MSYTEIIHVHAYNDKCRKKALDKAREISPGASDRLESVSIFLRRDWETEIVILLTWEERPGGQTYSTEGLSIVECLSRFGWVAHSAWTLDQARKRQTIGSR